MPRAFHIIERAVRVLAQIFQHKFDMQKIKLATVYERLNQNRLIKLLQHIWKVQGAELRRLDFNAAAHELDISRAQLARDVQSLERVQLIIVEGGELQLAPDILEEKKGA